MAIANPRVLAAVFAGGCLGAAARAGLLEALPVEAGHWPWATFAANVAGSFVLGLVVVRLQERLPPSTIPRPFLGTGLCGALTTFSAFQLELAELGRDGHLGLAAAYLAGSVVAGLAAVVAATVLVRRAWVSA